MVQDVHINLYGSNLVRGDLVQFYCTRIRAAYASPSQCRLTFKKYVIKKIQATPCTAGYHEIG